MYKGVTENVKQAQRIKNMASSDLLINIEVRPKFEEWFKANITFGFGMGWMKGMAKKFCWYGYFAGYKEGQ